MAYEVTQLLEASLIMISKELDRVMWNIHQKSYDSPFSNTGNYFKCDTFEVEAFSWSDDYEQPYNFKYKDIEITWYKYFGRGMSVNKSVSFSEIDDLLTNCLEALSKYQKDNCSHLI